VQVLLLSLLAMPITTVSGKSKLLSAGFILEPDAGIELLKEVFTSRVR
jgi:hypothetical protein